MKPVIWLLAFTAAFLALWHMVLDTALTVTAADLAAQGALDRATKAAAWQMTAESLAAGEPQIDRVQAAAAFYRLLAADLRLDPATLEPQAGSPLADKPRVSLLVYNGPSFPYVFVPRPGLQITLESPGAVAVLDGRYRNLGANGGGSFTRVAAARVLETSR